MKQFFGNFAFRRVRWVQETFVCTKFPAEIATTPTDVGGAAPYTGVWPFASIAGKADDRPRRLPRHVGGHLRELPLDHQPHRAAVRELRRDRAATRRRSSVPTPLDGRRRTRDDATTCRPARRLAWRFGVPVDRPDGARRAMAADPAIAECGVARVWNWALGKTDIVDTRATSRRETIEAQVDAFTPAASS